MVEFDAEGVPDAVDARTGVGAATLRLVRRLDQIQHQPTVGGRRASRRRRRRRRRRGVGLVGHHRTDHLLHGDAQRRPVTLVLVRIDSSMSIRADQSEP